MNPDLEHLMKENKLTEDSILFRYTYPEFLEHVEGNRYKLSANENATEMVEDLYGSGHLKMAKYIGKGLTFLSQKESEFDLPEKKCVQVRLKEILKQGGLIYPDRSSFVSGSFFITLPNGSVEVEMVSEKNE